MKKTTIGSLLVLISATLVAPQAIAQMGETNTLRMAQSSDDGLELKTRTEETLERVQNNDQMSETERMMFDVRRSEAFDLVRAGYRGDFEAQGVNSYGVFLGNYRTGDLTAEDLVKAAIEDGKLSPSAMEDESYVSAVRSQLDALVEN